MVGVARIAPVWPPYRPGKIPVTLSCGTFQRRNYIYIRVTITLMSLRALIIRLLHLTISEALGCNLLANKHVGRAEVLRQRQNGRHTEHITHQIACVIRNVYHTTQNSFCAPQALGERGKNANRIVAWNLTQRHECRGRILKWMLHKPSVHGCYLQTDVRTLYNSPEMAQDVVQW